MIDPIYCDQEQIEQPPQPQERSHSEAVASLNRLWNQARSKSRTFWLRAAFFGVCGVSALTLAGLAVSSRPQQVQRQIPGGQAMAEQAAAQERDRQLDLAQLIVLGREVQITSPTEPFVPGTPYTLLGRTYYPRQAKEVVEDSAIRLAAAQIVLKWQDQERLKLEAYQLSLRIDAAGAQAGHVCQGLLPSGCIERLQAQGQFVLNQAIAEGDHAQVTASNRYLAQLRLLQEDGQPLSRYEPHLLQAAHMTASEASQGQWSASPGGQALDALECASGECSTSGGGNPWAAQ